MKNEQDILLGKFRRAFYEGKPTESVALEDFTCVLEIDKKILYQWALLTRKENNRGKKSKSLRDISAELFVNKFLNQFLDKAIIADQIKRFGHSLQNEVRRFLEIPESTIKYGDDELFSEEQGKFHEMWEKELKKLNIVENLKDVLRGAIGQSGIASLTAFLIQDILRKICDIETNTPESVIRFRTVAGTDKILSLQECDTFDNAKVSSLFFQGIVKKFLPPTNEKPSILLITDINLVFDAASKTIKPDIIVRLYLNKFADKALLNAILIPLFLCKNEKIQKLLPESLTKYSMINSTRSIRTTDTNIEYIKEYIKILDPIYHDTFFLLLNPYEIPEKVLTVDYDLPSEKLKIQIDFKDVPKDKQKPVEILKCYCYSELTIKNCQQLTNDDLKKILAKNKDIEHLNISNCLNINDEISTWITFECHQLKTSTINEFKLQHAHFKFTQFGLPPDNDADTNNETQLQSTKSFS